MAPAQVKNSTNVHAYMMLGGRPLAAALESLSPRLAAWAVEPLFLSPRRHPRPEHEQAAFASAERSSVRHEGRRVAVYSWGSGPVVLFAHGWEGRATQVAPLLAPLLAAGFKVVSYDMLGHGASPRALVSVVDFAAVAQSVVRALGHQVHAAVGHSVGGTALSIAAARQPFTSHIAVIGSPLHPRTFVAQFVKGMGLSAATHAALVSRLEHRYELPFIELDASREVARSGAKGLVVHDRGDREVPFAHAERLSRAWPDSRLLATDGLGHRRILRDPDVVAAVTEFVASAPRARHWAVQIADELFEREARLARAS